MGWTKVPLYFCGSTKTATDIINTWLQSQWMVLPHCLDAVADTPLSSSLITALCTIELLPAATPLKNYHQQPVAKYNVQ
jgi:hypothetical protein